MTPLSQRIKARIKTDGAISVAEYIHLCLLDPTDGYYSCQNPLGADHDFITAPEISQIFGELLGLWALQCWRDMGTPAPVQLIECGPGRGLMMSDMLRAAQLSPAFLKALRVSLVETSPVLESIQAKHLTHCGVPVQWISSLKDAPNGEAIIIANEFLDCLPIRQFIRIGTPARWHERTVTLDADEQFGFGHALLPTHINTLDHFSAGRLVDSDQNFLEICPAFGQITDQLATRFRTHPGRALFIDYGHGDNHSQPIYGDSLQALRQHKKTDIFSAPGTTDISAHVDFIALANWAQHYGLKTTDILTQAQFLTQLGITNRTHALITANPHAKAKLIRQLERLTDPGQMGCLFKAICISSTDMEACPGF